jgi:hypothetical protein
MPRLALILYIFFVVVPLFFMQGIKAQTKKRKIDFEANIVQVSKTIAPDAKRLLGNVVFKHQGAIMYCDSAYYYSDSNSLDAFSNVYINQGDTLHLYSDYAEYEGNTRMSRATDNVKMIDKDEDGTTTLYTEYLEFDMEKNIGYYPDSGTVINENNRLTSLKGYYYADDEMYFFKDSVRIYTDEYTIYSDTVKYHTPTKISYFFGPTEIISDQNYIYCENGWYDNDQDVSQFSENAYLLSGNQRLKGDSLYYDRVMGIGEAFKNVEMYDSVEDVIINGQYGIYYEFSDSATVTDSAVFKQIAEGDTLYLHADTLRSVADSMLMDSVMTEYKIIRAYNKVRIYRTDFQGKCDSLTYTSHDSLFRMFVDPIIWSEENQITADYIEMYSGEGRVDSLKMYNNSFIISQEDTVKYNQIKGKNMVGYFRDNELFRIDVFGNGQTIYFVKEEEDVIGVNKTESLNMVIYREEKQIKKIVNIQQPEAVFMDHEKADPADLILINFRWLDYIRPKSRDDIFIWVPEKDTD